MRVRDAVPADSDAVRTVHRDSILGLGLQGYASEQVEAWAAGCASTDYRDAITADSVYYRVAERDGDVVGFGSLNHDVSVEDYASRPDAEVTAVYVHPDAAGEGIGSTLYEDLEAHAAAQRRE